MIYRGVKYSKDIQIKNRSDGQAVDISTWQFSATLVDGDGTTVRAMSTSGGQFNVFDGADGWFRIQFTTAETAAMAAGPVTAGIYRTDESDGPSRIGRMSEQVRERD
jgi:hypothetical protein